MKTKVHLYSRLRTFAGDQGTVEVEGATVGECLEDLVGQFPRLREKLFDKSGNISSIVYVSINMNSTNPEKKETPLKEGDELYIVMIIPGG
jgi:sulfur-carrier protein